MSSESGAVHWALITGASSGIGEGFARELASRGRSLILVSRDRDSLEKIKSDIQSKYSVGVEIIEQDLAHPHSAHELWTKVQEHGWAIDLLINNAGIGVLKAMTEHSVDETSAMLYLNAWTPTVLTQLFVTHWKRNGLRGSILNTASTAAFQSVPYMAVYAGTKALLLNISEAVDYELQGTGIRVLALCPGGTRTNFFKRAGFEPNATRMMLSSVDAVVRDGLIALEQGQSVKISGFLNALGVFLSRFVPRQAVTRVAAFVMGK